MTAGRNFLLITIRSTAPRMSIPKSWFVFGGLMWALIILAVVTL